MFLVARFFVETSQHTRSRKLLAPTWLLENMPDSKAERSEKDNSSWPPSDSRYFSNISQNHWERIQALFNFPVKVLNCFTWKRWKVVRWLGEEYLCPALHDCNYPDPEGLERFLTTAEHVYSLRQQKKHAEISQFAACYLIQERRWDKPGYKKFFIAQILWSFYERYPKCIPDNTKDHDPFDCAIDGMLTLSDSQLVKLIPDIGALADTHFGQGRIFHDRVWLDGGCTRLCRRVLKLVRNNAELENVHTVAIRKGFAWTIRDNEAYVLREEALEISKKVHGQYHPVTWELTNTLVIIIHLKVC
ncbi:hypothetical protein VTN77DRAFT_7712 [Rasamsonia byssochlamydoides]|uniref:uncharacterized protein n=1 Tax=Rasamsonia byssochlamydoides TaxID=89139 RepID=UPI003744870E